MNIDPTNVEKASRGISPSPLALVDLLLDGPQLSPELREPLRIVPGSLELKIEIVNVDHWSPIRFFSLALRAMLSIRFRYTFEKSAGVSIRPIRFSRHPMQRKFAGLSRVA